MNSTEKGNLSELKIAVRLLEKGKVVLRSIGEGCRYDLLIDENGKFTRIQCKTGLLKKGAVIFNTVSTYAWKKQVRGYHGSAELFGVYCLQLDKCYLVPVHLVATRHGSIRVEPTKNGQLKGILFATQFEI